MGSITRTFANNITANGVSAVAPGTVAPEDTTTGSLGVPAVTSNPPTPSLSAGDLWVRTDLTSNQLKGYLAVTGSWSTAIANYGNPQGTVDAGGGPNTAAWVALGYQGESSPPRRNHHYTFDGTAYTTKTNVPYSASSGFGAGTETAHTVGGGHRDDSTGGAVGGPYYLFNKVESWNGSAWASETNMPTYISGVSAAHQTTPETDITIVGMWVPGSPTSTNALGYDGSTWSSLTAVPSAGRYGTTGPTTNMLVCHQTGSTTAFNFDNTTYTTITSPPSAWDSNANFGNSGDDAYQVGAPGSQTTTLSWDSTAWATEANHTANTPGKKAGGTDAGWTIGDYPASSPTSSGNAYIFTAPGFGVVNLN